MQNDHKKHERPSGSVPDTPDTSRAGHPGWRRCSSQYSRHARSSRLASQPPARDYRFSRYDGWRQPRRDMTAPVGAPHRRTPSEARAPEIATIRPHQRRRIVAPKLKIPGPQGRVGSIPTPGQRFVRQFSQCACAVRASRRIESVRDLIRDAGKSKRTPLTCCDRISSSKRSKRCSRVDCRLAAGSSVRSSSR